MAYNPAIANMEFDAASCAITIVAPIIIISATFTATFGFAGTSREWKTHGIWIALGDTINDDEVDDDDDAGAAISIIVVSSSSSFSSSFVLVPMVSFGIVSTAGFAPGTADPVDANDNADANREIVALYGGQMMTKMTMRRPHAPPTEPWNQANIVVAMHGRLLHVLLNQSSSS